MQEVLAKFLNLHFYEFLVQNNFERAMFPLLSRQLDENQNMQDRRNFQGHVTSSFALLNPEKTALLMIHHLGFDKWLFPGGHYEGYTDEGRQIAAPRKSALRELNEETGWREDNVGWLATNDYVALDLDSHEIPARPKKDEDAHWHHDFLYLGIALEHQDLIPQLEEVSEAKWILLEDAALLPDERVSRAVKKIIKRIQV